MKALCTKIICDESGNSELVEFVGLFPFFIAMLMLILQAMDAGHTFMTSMSAAREGVRAAVVGDNCQLAAGQASALWESDSRRVSCGCSGVTCVANVELRVRKIRFPFAVHVFDNYWIPYQAVMRNEQ